MSAAGANPKVSGEQRSGRRLPTQSSFVHLHVHSYYSLSVSLPEETALERLVSEAWATGGIPVSAHVMATQRAAAPTGRVVRRDG